MKPLILLLLTAVSLNAADIAVVGPDVRIVGTTRVDLAPIHDWMDQGHKPADRPLKHWKLVKVQSVEQTAPWQTCYVQIDRKEHKTIYLKNVPKEIIQYLNEVSRLETQRKALADEIADDRKNLVMARSVIADHYSEYNQNRRIFAAKLKNKEADLDAIKEQLKELKSKEDQSSADLAMFTGQVYNKLEVWDFGLKQ